MWILGTDRGQTESFVKQECGRKCKETEPSLKSPFLSVSLLSSLPSSVDNVFSPRRGERDHGPVQGCLWKRSLNDKGVPGISLGKTPQLSESPGDHFLALP